MASQRSHIMHSNTYTYIAIYLALRFKFALCSSILLMRLYKVVLLQNYYRTVKPILSHAFTTKAHNLVTY